MHSHHSLWEEEEEGKKPKQKQLLTFNDTARGSLGSLCSQTQRHTPPMIMTPSPPFPTSVCQRVNEREVWGSHAHPNVPPSHKSAVQISSSGFILPVGWVRASAASMTAARSTEKWIEKATASRWLCVTVCKKTTNLYNYIYIYE